MAYQQFLAKETLLNDREVICHSPSDSKSHANERCKFIVSVEEELFNKCFGWLFYEMLMKDKINYGTDGIPYTELVQGQSYTMGDVVLYEHKLYVVEKALFAKTPINSPSCFSIAPKFYNANYNFIWQRYLCFILATSVMYTSVLYRLIRDTSSGVVKTFNEGSSTPVSLPEISALKKEAMVDCDRAMAAMQLHIRRNPECYPNFGKHPVLAAETCATVPCTPKRKNYGVKF